MKSIAQSDLAVNGSGVLRCSPATPEKRPETISAALHAANQRLLARRRQLSAAAQAEQIPPGPAVAAPDAADRAGLRLLPAHLGWGSDAITQTLRRGLAAESPPPTLLRIVNDPCVKPERITAPTDTERAPVVKAYPSLLTAIVGAEATAAGRVWLLCRYLDTAGQGWLPVPVVRQRLAGRQADAAGGSSLKICGWRRLRQIFQQGEGIFWSRDAQGRLWLFGAARVAARLGVVRLAGRPVLLPVADLVRSIGHVRAHFYASFHSRRAATARAEPANPISRATLSAVTHVPARTQRRYERLVRVKKQANIAVGDSAENGSTALQEEAWQRGRAVFTFVDHSGIRGRAGARYVAWHLPNRYQGCHQQAPLGRHKKINRQLKQHTQCPALAIDLVELRERGNGSQCDAALAATDSAVERAPACARLFHADGRRAAQRNGRSEDVDAYWFDATTQTKEMAVWHVRGRR